MNCFNELRKKELLEKLVTASGLTKEVIDRKVNTMQVDNFCNLITRKAGVPCSSDLYYEAMLYHAVKNESQFYLNITKKFEFDVDFGIMDCIVICDDFTFICKSVKPFEKDGSIISHCVAVYEKNKTIPIYYIYLSLNYTKKSIDLFTCTSWEYKKLFKETDMQPSILGGHTHLMFTANDDLMNKLNVPSCSYVLSCLSHVENRYRNPRVVTTKSNREHSKVHEVRESASEHYVRLVRYENSNKKTPSKGGHHKSPIPHERSEHYRLCKIAGDYIKNTDGTYTYVGGRKGTHCHVSGSSINTPNDGKTIVYVVD